MPKVPTCPTHHIPLTCAACAAAARGRVRSPAKTAAARRAVQIRWARARKPRADN